MKILMITNPVAGKGRGFQIAEYAIEYLKKKNIIPDVLKSEYQGHIHHIFNDIDMSHYQGILAVGGDGTLFETINGLLKRHPDLELPVGQIPVGTGNSFIKDLGIDTPETALEKIVGGRTKKIDVGYFKSPDHQFYFINLLGAGFVADVALKAIRYKSLGALSYIIGVIQEVARLSTYQLEITIDDHIYHRENVFVEICNSTKTGGDMVMAPEAKIDDGLLDIILLNKISRLNLLKAFPKIFKGSHLSMKEVEFFKGQTIKVVTDAPKKLNVDGEVIGTTPIEVSILPKKIDMFY